MDDNACDPEVSVLLEYRHRPNDANVSQVWDVNDDRSAPEGLAQEGEEGDSHHDGEEAVITDGMFKRLRGALFSIAPWQPEKLLQPISYEMTLDGDALVPRKADAWMNKQQVTFVDPGDPKTFPLNNIVEIPERTSSVIRVIPPGGFILGATEQTITLGSNVAARFEGKSSLGRLGLFVHVTAGLVDPGWVGQLTVELYNAAPYPIRLWRGMPIGQLTIEMLDEHVEVPYGSPELGSHYQHSLGVVPSRGVVR